VPPATESRPTPIPSGPVPTRSLRPETVRAQPIPLTRRQIPASCALAPHALMGITAFPLVAKWRSQATSGRDSAMSPPAETARRPPSSPAQDSDLDSLGPLDFGSGAPLLLEGELVLTSVPGYCDMDLAAAPDAAVGGPLDAPVPADLAPPLQPAVLSAPRVSMAGQCSPQALVEACPPEAEPSGSGEVAVPAHWEAQVEEAEASDGFQRRPVVVPDWANMETPPVPDVPRHFASPSSTTPSEAVVTAVEPRPMLDVRDVLNAIRPVWYEGGPAHCRVVDDLLARFSSPFEAACLISALGWMLLQRQDVGLYLDWWISERQALSESPANTLRVLREILARLQHAPFE